MISDKINVGRILSAHWSTMVDGSSRKLSFPDIFTFYLVPAGSAAISIFFCLDLGKDFIEVSIAVFGIFVGLMLNVKVALFNIHTRPWKMSKDKGTKEIQKRKLKERSSLLSEINANLSYIILISILAILLCLAFSLAPITGFIETAVLVLTYVHTILILMLTLKRSFVLFDNEYNSEVANDH